MLPAPRSAWLAARDLPEPPRETFRDWWTREGHRSHDDHPAGDGTIGNGEAR